MGPGKITDETMLNVDIYWTLLCPGLFALKLEFEDAFSLS